MIFYRFFDLYREFELNNWSCRCQPLLDLERPFYSSVFILQSLFDSGSYLNGSPAADWLHIISHYQEAAAVPLPCWFHSQVARFSHLVEKAGNGRDGTASVWKQVGLLSCCSSGLMKCPWSPVRPAFNWLQEHSEEAQTEEVRTNEPEVKRYGPRLWLWWLWAMKVSYYYRYYS